MLHGPRDPAPAWFITRLAHCSGVGRDSFVRWGTEPEFHLCGHDKGLGKRKKKPGIYIRVRIYLGTK